MGILLLRVTLGNTLIVYAVMWVMIADRSSGWNWLLGFVSIFCGMLLLLGFITPVVSILVCVAGATSVLVRLFTLGAIRGESGIIEVFVSVAAAAIILMGPGAISLDARLFGRREIVIPRNSTRSRS